MTSSNSSEDTILCETTQSTSQQYLTSLDASQNITTSCEDTPCLVIQLTQEALIITPNKPIITKMMFDTYSPYLICTFNSTINYVKETVEERTYIEIKKLLQMKDQLILQETLVKKLEEIFETDYTEIESKILNKTIIMGDNQTEEARFNFFARYALLDFTANFKYRLPRFLCHIKYEWIEKDVASIKGANNMFMDDINGIEIMNTEVSGPPFKATQAHTIGDAKKLLMMSVCSLCRIFGNNLDCSVKDAKGIKTYSIQIIGDCLTLFSISLIDQNKFLAVELASCLIPFSFDAISYYTKIFNFFMIIQTEFVNQEKLWKKIYSSVPVNNSERIRDWLFLPDDYYFYDLKLVPEDIDKVLMT
nr:4788_t:CDS:2 [Entrophospora candida]